ncbi:MAG: hypothetical protein WD334_12470 [Chitinophagales bacterium]
MNKSIELDKRQIDQDFVKVRKRIYKQFKKNPDVDACLFIIGMRELGQLKIKFNKEEKTYLMHIAVCRLMSEDGYYQLEGTDEDGWPHWKAKKPLPKLNGEDQEYLLKQYIIRYFYAL